MKFAMRSAFGCAMVAGSACSLAQVQPDPSLPVVVQEQQNMVEQFEPVWTGAGADDHLSRPSHPPIHLIPEMPMPDPSEDIFPNMGPGVPLTRDLVTGTTTQEPLHPGTGLGFGSRAGFESGYGEGAGDDLPFAESFGTMFQINNVGDDPWRRNVKLVMRFVDSNGISRFFVASGSMADAETVLTAGHCVYARTPNGLVINDWAQEIWVYPGWDGNGTTGSTSQIIQTHGIGYASGLGAFTGWTQNGNFDWDMGLIRITRGVGMLTGWYGSAWGGSCSFSQNELYNNPGYPAENCPTSGLHNGRDMYNWNGNIDSCPGNQLQIDTTSGCLTAMWGGQSGSAAYYFDANSNRIAHAVASNSNRSTIGRYAKMWESFSDYMIDFENDSRGTALDVQALMARYDETVVTAGQTIGGNGYVIANPTNNNPPSQTYNLSHRLSTNAIISSSDTLLSQTFISADLGPVSSVSANNLSSSYTVPKNTPSGNYYVGVLLDIADANTGNNATSYWDAHAVTVNGVADISADSISTPGNIFLRGETFTATIDYSNLGGDPSNIINADFRLSNNDFISTGDIPLGTTSYSGLAGDGSSTRNRTVTLPIVTPGTYWLGVILTASDDVDGSNNWVASIPLQINARYCADQNGDGRISPSDFNAWILNFNNGDPRADVNGDGIVSPADFNGWILAYNQGTSGPICTP